MKTKFLLSAFLCAFTIMACGQKTGPSYTISGHIEGLKDGSIVEVVPYSHNTEKAIATDTVENGRFEFTGQTPEPRAMTLVVKDTYGGYKFMLENSKIEISGKAVFIGENNQYEFKDMQITGSPLTDSLYAKIAFKDKLDEQYNDFHTRYNNTMAQAKEAEEKGDMATAKKLKEEAKKQIEQDESKFFTDVEQQVNQSILDNKDTFWGPLMMICHLNL